MRSRPCIGHRLTLLRDAHLAITTGDVRVEVCEYDVRSWDTTGFPISGSGSKKYIKQMFSFSFAFESECTDLDDFWHAPIHFSGEGVMIILIYAQGRQWENSSVWRGKVFEVKLSNVLGESTLHQTRATSTA